MGAAITTGIQARKGALEMKRFPTGERYIRVATSVREQDVILVGGTVDAGRAMWVESLANDMHIQAGFVYKKRNENGKVPVSGTGWSAQDFGDDHARGLYRQCRHEFKEQRSDRPAGLHRYSSQGV